MIEVFTRLRVAAAWAVLALALSAAVQAQNTAGAPKPAVQAQRADAADAKGAVPPVVYRSPMQGYRPYADTEPASWVDTNNNVGRIGGWRVYAKEARQPDDAPSAPKASASAPQSDAAKPQPAGHQGHKMN